MHYHTFILIFSPILQQMGANQQRTHEIWITIQRSSKVGQKEMFDFSKQRIIVSSNKVYFPSYLHYYEQTRTVTYSLLQDRQNQFACLDLMGVYDKQVCFNKTNEAISGKIWRLLRDDEDVELQEGDFIKLGRIQLQLKELVITNNKKSVKSLLIEFQPDTKSRMQMFPYLHPNNNSSRFLKNSDIMSKFAQSRMKDSDIISMVPSDYNLKKSIFTQRSSNEQICRFCFDGSSHKSNPLFNVCQCAGSVKLIHYLCLKNWIKSKMGKIQTSHCIYYHYEPLVCELCKQMISNQIKHEGRTYSLFQPQKIHPPYARFQHFEDNKVFQILIRLEESSIIQIGRGPENELYLNDSSISRSHSSLFYTSRQLFLKGKSSKYGTFVELTKNIEPKIDHPIELLIQNNLITMNRKPGEKGFFEQQCCHVENPFKMIVK